MCSGCGVRWSWSPPRARCLANDKKYRQARLSLQARLSCLGNVRILLEEARIHARNMGSPEGERLQVQIRTMLRDANRRIHDLRASSGQ